MPSISSCAFDFHSYSSTIMLLTIPWAFSIFQGRVDLDANKNPVYTKPKGAQVSPQSQQLKEIVFSDIYSLIMYSHEHCIFICCFDSYDFFVR